LQRQGGSRVGSQLAKGEHSLHTSRAQPSGPTPVPVVPLGHSWHVRPPVRSAQATPGEQSLLTLHSFTLLQPSAPMPSPS
jgi:hypothetical protein